MLKVGEKVSNSDKEKNNLERKSSKEMRRFNKWNPLSTHYRVKYEGYRFEHFHALTCTYVCARSMKWYTIGLWDNVSVHKSALSPYIQLECMIDKLDCSRTINCSAHVETKKELQVSFWYRSYARPFAAPNLVSFHHIPYIVNTSC